jgi:aminoglycoside phosphotransferase (APT) family kinase protein
VGEIVEVDGRYGLVYEKVRGRSMMESLGGRPWTFFRAARELARLQAEMHGIVAIPELPSQHRRLREKIEEAVPLDAGLRSGALAALASLTPGDRLCHGDFHPGNVLFTARGPVIIDWIDATRGSPGADLARSLLLMDLAPLPFGTPARLVTAAIRGAFRRVYLRRYFQLCPTDRSMLEQWTAVNAAARLSEGVPEEGALLDIVNEAFGHAEASGAGASPC